jgi:hypothetical protein
MGVQQAYLVSARSPVVAPRTAYNLISWFLCSFEDASETFCGAPDLTDKSILSLAYNSSRACLPSLQRTDSSSPPIGRTRGGTLPADEPSFPLPRQAWRPDAPLTGRTWAFQHRTLGESSRSVVSDTGKLFSAQSLKYVVSLAW